MGEERADGPHPALASATPVLALVTDCGRDPSARLTVIREALGAGANWVQLRDRTVPTVPLLHFADQVRRACEEAGAYLVVNRRLDVALASGADGVHLGGDAVAVADARDSWNAARAGGPRVLVGCSTHSADEALSAWQQGADYVHLAPVYPPLSKPSERPPLGPGPLADLAAQGVPVLAQGGVELDRVAAVIGAGARGVAVTGTLLDAPACGPATRELREALDRGAGGAPA